MGDGRNAPAGGVIGVAGGGPQGVGDAIALTGGVGTQGEGGAILALDLREFPRGAVGMDHGPAQGVGHRGIGAVIGKAGGIAQGVGLGFDVEGAVDHVPVIGQGRVSQGTHFTHQDARPRECAAL